MDHAAALIEENRSLAVIIAAADLATPVPTTPEWDLRKLATHVGRGDRWAATIVRDIADGPVDPRTVADGRPPADDVADWLRSGVTTLLDAVAATGPDTPVWTFIGPQRAAWWIRRRLHESVVHRADAALAVGVPFQVAPDIAADAISEWLDLLSARRDAAPLPDGVTLHLHATDDGLGEAGEWLIRCDAGAVTWKHGHGKGAAAVRGPAADLLLAAMRRIPADAVEVLGEEKVWAAWLDHTPF